MGPSSTAVQSFPAPSASSLCCILFYGCGGFSEWKDEYLLDYLNVIGNSWILSSVRMFSFQKFGFLVFFSHFSVIFSFKALYLKAVL